MRRAVAPHPWCVVAVAALTAAALVIRASQLDQSLFGDELYALYEIDGRSFASMLETVYEGPEVTPPLFFALAWLSAQLGDPTVLIRLPSLAGGVLLVPLTFVLGVRTVGSRAALVGATIVTLAPLAIFYAVEARPYGLLAAATVASTIALLRALESDRWAWWAAYGLASLAAMYTHLTAVFVLTAQLAWAAYAHRDRIPRLLIVNGAAALLFLPWAPRLLRDDLPTLVSTYGPFSARPEDLLRVVGHILPGSPFVTLGRLPGVAATVAFCAVVAAALLAGARRRTASETHLGLLVLSGAAVPAGLITYGVLSDDALFTPRTSITMLPYAALVIGALVARLPERAAAVVWLGLAVALGVGTIGALGDAGERPPYREAAAYVAERARPGDVVLERELFAGTGPWTRHFAIYLAPGLEYRRQGVDEAWEGLRPGGRIFFVQLAAGADPGAPPRLGPDDGHVPAVREVLPGIHPVAVTTYVRAARGQAEAGTVAGAAARSDGTSTATAAASWTASTIIANAASDSTSTASSSTGSATATTARPSRKRDVPTASRNWTAR